MPRSIASPTELWDIVYGLARSVHEYELLCRGELPAVSGVDIVRLKARMRAVFELEKGLPAARTIPSPQEMIYFRAVLKVLTFAYKSKLPKKRFLKVFQWVSEQLPLELRFDPLTFYRTPEQVSRDGEGASGPVQTALDICGYHFFEIRRSRSRELLEESDLNLEWLRNSPNRSTRQDILSRLARAKPDNLRSVVDLFKD